MKQRKYLIDPKLMTPFQRGLELHCILEECVFRFVRPPVPVSSGQAFRCDPASMI